MFLNQTPIFISILFLIAFIFPVFMIANLVKTTIEANKRTKIISFYIFYLTLVSIASFRGLFDTISLPPKIILVTTLPLLVFYLLIISNTLFYNNLLKEVTLSNLVKVHIFRLVGSFFLILFFYRLLPKPLALIAGIGDVTTAITSLFVASSIQPKRVHAKTLTLIWNTFGLLDIFLTSAMAIMYTKISIDTGSMGVEILAKFPYCFIPAFAPATIIFLHISIYRKIFNKKFH